MAMCHPIYLECNACNIRIAIAEYKTERWFQAAVALFTRWGKHLLVTVLVGLGFILIVDGIGWFFGKPLIPVG
jgi:hypothetical protein